MNIYSGQVEEAIRAVVFHSDTCYSWLGRRLPSLTRSVKRPIRPEEARGYLVYNLQNQLYTDFYSQGLARRREPVDSRLLPGLTPFVQALSAANTGRGCHENGWLVSGVKNDEIVARKNGPEFRISLKECCNPHGGPITPGTLVTVHLPKELLNISPHFYMALGNEQLPYGDATEIIRFYWNLTASAAAPFMHCATRLLNEANLPFNLKVLRDPDLYTRCDAGVIYALKKTYGATVEVLVKVYRLMAGKLKTSTPVFTKPLAPGLGLAENPPSTQSFGEHRCGLLANAMVLAHEQDIKSINDRLTYVAEHFEREQIRIEAPFLNPRSFDNYHFPRVS
jgi:HopA1 effector protein family